MASTVHTKATNAIERPKRVRRFIHAEMRTPVEMLKANAMVRSTQWEPVVGLPKGVDSLGKMATAGVIS